MQAKSLSGDSTVGCISPGSHRGTARLIHHTPIGIRIRHALRISLTIADRKEEIHLVAGLVDDIGDAVATLADTEVIIRQSATREDIRQQHIVDIADVRQMTIPVEGIGVPALHLRIHGIARQTVLPEA